MNRLISNTFTKILTAAVAVIAVGVCTDSASANEYNHINRMAVKIRNQTKTLLKETEHYVRTTNYRLLVADTATLRQMAEHVREIAREGCDLDHLATSIAEMNQTFYHLHELFDTTELVAAQFKGSIKGHTAHVKRLLTSIEQCLLNMEQDLDALQSPVLAPPELAPPELAQPVVAQRPVIERPYPYRRSPRPIVTNVETYTVPARDYGRAVYPYGGPRPGYGAAPGCPSRGARAIGF